MSFNGRSLATHRFLLTMAAIGFIGTASPGYAQGFISPFVGYDFGGDAKCAQLSGCTDTRLNVGVALGAMGSLIGFEEEVGYAPDFFGSGTGLNSSVLTVMSNLMLAPKIGPVRPYVLAGTGLMKSHVELKTASILTTDNNTVGWDVGGGVMGMISGHFGVRGDLRYFHSFKDLTVLGFTLENSKLNFGRASVGAVLKF